MSDIASSLPVRGATGDLLVNLFDYAGNTFNPATKDLQVSILAGVTAMESSQASILAGITSIDSKVATENTLGSVLAGVTAIESSQASMLAGITAIAGTVALESTQKNVLAGVTAIEASQASILAGITSIDSRVALENTQKDVLAGVTGIKARLPVSLGATAMAASLAVAMATDQNPIPVYVTSGASTTPVVQFNTGSGVAYLSGITGSYSPANPFVLNTVHAAGSGRIKLEVYAGNIASWAYDATRLKWVGFNSTSNPNIDIDCSDYKLTASTQKVEAIVTNYENGKAQDLYLTIVGDLT